MLQKEKQLDRATMSTSEKSDFIQKCGANDYFKLPYKGKCEEFPFLESGESEKIIIHLGSGLLPEMEEIRDCLFRLWNQESSQYPSYIDILRQMAIAFLPTPGDFLSKSFPMDREEKESLDKELRGLARIAYRNFRRFPHKYGYSFERFLESVLEDFREIVDPAESENSVKNEESRKASRMTHGRFSKLLITTARPWIDLDAKKFADTFDNNPKARRLLDTDRLFKRWIKRYGITGLFDMFVDGERERVVLQLFIQI